MVGSEVAETFTVSPPLRFGLINPGVYRGAYPVLSNFRFLHSLNLKMILSLTPEAPTEDLQNFSDHIGCRVVHFPILRTAALNDYLHSTLIQALQVQ